LRVTTHASPPRDRRRDERTTDEASELVPTWVLRLVSALVLVGLVAYSAWQRWQALNISPFPLGVDGYYYPLQVRALMETHSLQYPASPLTFWFMLPFAQATDPITGAKLGAAIGGALIAFPAYAVGVRLGRTRGAGFVAAVMSTQLAASQYLASEFVKQGFGLTVALAAVWLVLRALEKPTTERIGLAVVGFVAALATHKLAAGLVVVVAVPGMVEEARGRGVLRGRRLVYLVLALVVGAVGLAILGLVAPQRFLGGHEVSLLGELVGTKADWSLPALSIPPPTAGVHAYRLVFDHEAVIGLVSAIAAAIVWRLQRRWPTAKAPVAVVVPPAHRRAYGVRAVAWIAILLALVIAMPVLRIDDPQGLGFRLRLAAFVPAALCAAIAIGGLSTLIRGALPALLRDAILLVASAILAISIPIDRAEGRVLVHPALVTASLAARTQIPPNTTVIVPERHIVFMVAWYTRASVALRPEAVPPAQRIRILPLSFIGMGSPLDRALDDARVEPGLTAPIGVHSRHRNGLVLVTEPTWDWLVDRLGESGRQRNGLSLVGKPAWIWILGLLGDPGGYWARWPTI
jgi:hypothetical protein